MTDNEFLLADRIDKIQHVIKQESCAQVRGIRSELCMRRH